MEAHALQQQGWTISAIARHLRRNRRTVRNYLNGVTEPGARKKPEVDPFQEYVEYITLRLTADPHLEARTSCRCSCFGRGEIRVKVNRDPDARSTASDDRAETAARIGIPAITAFCTSSNEARPLTIKTVPRRGIRSAAIAQPARVG